MELANRHDLRALHEMFWQSPSALLLAKLHNIARSGPVMLQPDFSKLKVVGLTHDLAESYANRYCTHRAGMSEWPEILAGATGLRTCTLPLQSSNLQSLRSWHPPSKRNEP
jgi:hypothetical protein